MEKEINGQEEEICFRLIDIEYYEKENGTNCLILKFVACEDDETKILWQWSKNDFNKIFTPLEWNGTKKEINELKKELKNKIFNFNYLISIQHIIMKPLIST